MNDLLELRQVAISNFSEDNIRTYESYSVLEDVFVPLYFYHRYQTEAVVKLIGGIDYKYAIKGEAGLIQKTLPKKEQQKALNAVLRTLEASTLVIPKEQLKLFPPRAYGYPRTRESFKSNMGVAFDAIGAAETASNMTLKLLLHPERVNRLIQQKAMDKKNLGLDDLLDQLLKTTFGSPKGSAYEKELQRTIQYITLQHILNLILSQQTIPQVKAIAGVYVKKIKLKISGGSNAFATFLLNEINTFERYPEKYKMMRTQKIPDGSPIGSYACSVFRETWQ